MSKTPLTDGFNPKLIEGALLQGAYDIPTIKPIPDTVPLPKSLVPFDKRHQTKEVHQWVHCYLFDQRFRQLLNNPEKYVEEVRPFDGFITPDFSLYREAPLSVQIYNTFLNRAFGYYFQKMGIPVITNIRWSTTESYSFCFDGAPKNNTLSVSNHGCLRGKENLYWFERGFDEMACRLEPKRIILYGRETPGLVERYPKIEITTYPSSFEMARKSA